MFLFARRRSLFRAVSQVRCLPIRYRRTHFIEQVLLGDFISLFLRRVNKDVQRILGTSAVVSLVFLYGRSVTPQILATFFIEKFKRMYLPGEVVARFFSKIVRGRYRRGKFVKGPSLWGISALMVKASGRFTRKQRAFYKMYKFGPLALSSVARNVNYFFKDTPLKFGAVGLKVYFVEDYENKKSIFYKQKKL